MPPPITVLDTCVLVPYLVRDTLLSAAEERLYWPAWSPVILEELDRTLRDEPFHLSDERIRYLLEAMRRAFPWAVVRDFEQLESRLTNHPNDRHVLAAAIMVSATSIVTDSVRHFLTTALGNHGIEVQTPDAFLAIFARQDLEGVLHFLTRQAAAMKQPPTDVPGLLAQLERQVPAFVSEVRRRMRRPPTA